MPSILNSDDGVVSGTSGLKTTGGNDGLLNIQTNGSTAMSVNASQQVTFNNGANLPNTFGFKNRLINGEMDIDQRNNGASVTATSPGYTLDRWSQVAGAGSVTVQRTSSVIPAGFSNSYGTTVASVNTRNAADYSFLYQTIEGFNVADLDLGLSTAATVTVSFWVRSSIAGLYSGVLASGDNTRSYGFTYTINAANTWEQKSVTIVGDTSGGKTAYPVDNTSGLRLKFDLGSGSNYQVTAGSWQAATNRVGVAGTVSWAQTAGATFYITGVQLEKGSTATSFDFRSYGTELALCQRYFYKATVFNTNTSAIYLGYFGGTSGVYELNYPVTMRTTPTATISQPTQVQVYYTSGWTNVTILIYSYNQERSINVYVPSDHSFNKLMQLSGGSTIPTASISAEL